MTLTEHLYMVVRRIQWTIVRIWAGMSALDMLAAALVLLWAGMQWQVILPLQGQKEVLASAVRHSNDAMAAGTLMPTQSVAASPVSPEATFLAFLPPVSQRDSMLKALHELIASQGLTLVHADYKLEAEPALPVDKLGLRLSVEGNYVPLRQFLHIALEKIPSLAINRIDLEKDGKTPDSMTMTLETSLYLRQETGGKPL